MPEMAFCARRLMPIVVVETTCPVESVARSALVSAVRYVLPLFVSCEVEAYVKSVVEAARRLVVLNAEVVALVVSPAYEVWVNGSEAVEQVEQVRVREPPRATDPPPPRGPVVFTVSAPPLFSKEFPIVVVETSFPVESTPRSAEERLVKYAFLSTVRTDVDAYCETRLVEDAVPKNPVPETARDVEEAKLMVWSAVHVLALESNWELETRHVPFMEKHPPARSMPLANVDVAAVPETLRYVVASAPENVEVELVPATFRNPWTVDVPVVSP